MCVACVGCCKSEEKDTAMISERKYLLGWRHMKGMRWIALACGKESVGPAGARRLAYSPVRIPWTRPTDFSGATKLGDASERVPHERRSRTRADHPPPSRNRSPDRTTMCLSYGPICFALARLSKNQHKYASQPATTAIVAEQNERMCPKLSHSYGRRIECDPKHRQHYQGFHL